LTTAKKGTNKNPHVIPFPGTDISETFKKRKKRNISSDSEITLTLIIPFPDTILPLLRTCLQVAQGEFGINPAEIFTAIDGWIEKVLGTNPDKGSVNLPEKWPSDLELNPLQVNYFLDQVIAASWKLPLSPKDLLLKKAFSLTPVVGKDHWLAEHEFARLAIGYQADRLHSREFGAWEFSFPKNQLSFDGYPPNNLRLALINRRLHLERKSSAPTTCQQSKEANQGMNGYLWVDAVPGFIPEGLEKALKFKIMED